MLNVIVVTIFAAFLIFCFALCLFVYFKIEKVRCDRAIKKQEIVRDIARLKKEINDNMEEIQKYGKIKEYVSGIDFLFERYIFKLERIKLTQVGIRNRNRIELFNEYKAASSDQVKNVFNKYASLLNCIYKYNHPVKCFLSEIKIRISIFVCWFILVVYFIFAGERANDRKKTIPSEEDLKVSVKLRLAT